MKLQLLKKAKQNNLQSAQEIFFRPVRSDRPV